MESLHLLVLADGAGMVARCLQGIVDARGVACLPVDDSVGACGDLGFPPTIGVGQDFGRHLPADGVHARVPGLELQILADHHRRLVERLLLGASADTAPHPLGHLSRNFHQGRGLLGACGSGGLDGKGALGHQAEAGEQDEGASHGEPPWGKGAGETSAGKSHSETSLILFKASGRLVHSGIQHWFAVGVGHDNAHLAILKGQRDGASIGSIGKDPVARGASLSSQGASEGEISFAGFTPLVRPVQSVGRTGNANDPVLRGPIALEGCRFHLAQPRVEHGLAVRIAHDHVQLPRVHEPKVHRAAVLPAAGLDELPAARGGIGAWSLAGESEIAGMIRPSLVDPGHRVALDLDVDLPILGSPNPREGRCRRGG